MDAIICQTQSGRGDRSKVIAIGDLLVGDQQGNTRRVNDVGQFGLAEPAGSWLGQTVEVGVDLDLGYATIVVEEVVTPTSPIDPHPGQHVLVLLLDALPLED